MARHRKIDLRMHADEKYRRLSRPQPCGQVLWWHLLAGPQTELIPGIFSIGEAAFAEMLRWTLKGFRDAFAEVSSEGMAKADWDAPIVFVPNALKYNAPANPNVVKSWHAAWDELPECALKKEAANRIDSFLKGLGKDNGRAFREAFAFALANPLANQEQEQEQEQEAGLNAAAASGGKIEALANEFLKAWNALGPPFKPIASMTEKRIETLASRAADAFWLSNWRRAIEAVPQQKFLRGEGERGWVATADFFLEPDTVAAILEGKYQDVHKPKPAGGRPGSIASGRVSAPPGTYANAGRNAPADETSGSGEQTPADPFEGLG